MATNSKFACWTGTLLLVSTTTPALAQGADTVRFNRDIRPILSDNCFQCHGPDKNQRKAKLRLDVEEGALAERDGHPAIVPGKTAESELYRRITTLDDDDRMPPAKTGRRLTESEIALLKRWIEQGAKWEAHWSFVPPVRPKVPTVKQAAWPRNPIDSFILSRLEAQGLAPSGEADKRTLIRRLSFDLTGLPPTPDEVQEFETDTSEEAYDRLVHRLLSSPHYGERMASHWLDLVRYADTDGFHADNYRSVYPYRDYVIKAFNDNMPFDQFTIEQLAGDLLLNATQWQKVASTYNRLNRTTEEGGSQAKEYLAKYAADRVRTTSTVWLGATLGCAECHDHKFDPYTTKDFYSFAAYFADIKEVGVGKPEGILLPNEKQSAELQRLDAEIARAEQKLHSITNQLVAIQSQWEATMRTKLDAGDLAWAALKPYESISKNGATLELQEDLSLLASGENPKTDEYVIGLATDRAHITAVRLEVLSDLSAENSGSSRATGAFVLTDVKVEVMSGKSIRWEPVSIANAIADSAKRGFPVSAAIDDKPESGWSVDDNSKARDHQAAFLFQRPVAGGPGTRLRVQLRQQAKQPHQTIGRFRLALSTVAKPVLTEHGLPEEAISALRKAAADRSETERVALTKYYLDTSEVVTTATAQINAVRQVKADYTKDIPTTLASVSVEPRTMRILPRGNWMDDSGPIVQPAIPEFLSTSHKTPSNDQPTRLDLGRWLASRENPLAARAFVNRLWKMYFGVGISRVLDDLGAQGEWPKHAELLDWLAVEFIDSGWNVKHVITLMISSATYRQKSDGNDLLRERDPFNRLLARQSRFRLEGELVRDSALRISGLLVDQIGGPSVKPYQPEGYWQHLNFPKRTYQHDPGAAQYRRGLYTFWCRTFLHPSLLAMDAPGREECTATRVASNNPLQALVLLNDPTYVEAARVFAERALRMPLSGTEDRIRWIFRQAVMRMPTSPELRLLSELYQKQQTRYAAERKAAEQLIATGEWPVPKDLDPVELASWTSVCRSVLNLHETITRF